MLAARAVAHDAKLVYSGPLYRSLTIDGSRAVVRFDHVGGRLVAKDGPLSEFEIAGEDRRFVPAKATIEGDTVVVESPKVSKPVAVRYGWKDVALMHSRKRDRGAPLPRLQVALLQGVPEARPHCDCASDCFHAR